MKEVLSLFMSIGEMDTAYIIIAFAVIAILWFLFRMLNNRK